MRSDGLPGEVENVLREVAHEVVKPLVVVLAMRGISVPELVQEDLRLASVTHSELGYVELIRERPGQRQPIPDREQLGDKLAGCVAIPCVALAAGQSLLVAVAGRLLPLRQRRPVERVEVPDAALRAGAPVLQED